MAKKQFKAESKRLLEMMINSIYTHKEIFLREIISNSSDALDKLCYKSLTENETGISRDDLFIKISVDKENRTIKVSDNGIGMTGEELEKNLGIIANSGSLHFKNDMEKNEEINLAFTPETNEFNGRISVQLMIKDVQFIKSPYKIIDCRNQQGGFDKIYDFLQKTKKLRLLPKMKKLSVGILQPCLKIPNRDNICPGF